MNEINSFARRIAPRLWAFFWILAAAPAALRSDPLDQWQVARPASQASALYGVAYGNGVWTAVGKEGTALASADGVQWGRGNLKSINDLYAVAYGNGRFVADGAASSYGIIPDFTAIIVSNDGTNWSEVNLGWYVHYFYGAGYGDGTFVACGGLGEIFTTNANGDWTSRTSAVSSGSTLFDAAYGDGTFVAVGNYQNVVYSNDHGTNWSQFPTGLPGKNRFPGFNGVVYGNNLWIAVGDGGLGWFYDSTTDSNGVSVLPSGGHNLQSVAYGNGSFVAVGDAGTILSSSDGVNWTARNSGATNGLNRIAYGNGAFVAVGDGGLIIQSGASSAAPAPPLITAQPQSQTVAADGSATFSVNASGAPPLRFQWLKDGAPLPGQTNATLVLNPVQIADSGAYAVIVSNSAGSVTSIPATLAVTPANPTAAITALASPASGGSVSGAGNYPVGSQQQIAAAPNAGWIFAGWSDGVKDNPRTVSVTAAGAAYTANFTPAPAGLSWQVQSVSNVGNFQSIAYGNGGFVAVNSAGKVFNSADAIHWTTNSFFIKLSSQLFQPPQFSAARFGGGYFLVSGNEGYSGAAYASADGVQWAAGNGVKNYPTDTVYGGGLFVAVGRQDTILVSADATNWTAANLSGASFLEHLDAAAFGNSTFVAVGGSQFGGAAVIATSADGSNWVHASSAALPLNGVVFAAGQFVAVGQSGGIATSSDGAAWTNQNSGVSANLNAVGYGSGVFVAAGDGGAILTSNDGAHWAPSSSQITVNLRDVIFANQLFYIVGDNGATLSAAPSGSVPETPVKIGQISFANHTFTLSVPTEAGRTYFMEYKNSLSDPLWSVAGSRSGAGSAVTFSDDTAAAPARYYRIRAQ